MKTEFKIILGTFLFIGLTVFAFTQKHHKTNPIYKNYKIINQWELPPVLQEISGISWIGDHKIACIEDEDGTIFIYNLKTSSIEQRIDFADQGDYEDIAIVNHDAYVLRSDGIIFEVENYLTNPTVEKFSTFNDVSRNVEGLTLDKANNRLLIAVKDEKHKEKAFKGVYAFSIETKKFQFLPVYKIDLKNEIFKNIDEKKTHKLMRPSALTVTNNAEKIYYLDGAQPKFLVTDAEGNLEKLYQLNEEEFYQPEGITISPDNRIFISNEGKKAEPNILEVEFY
ncbi:SdiA-regulated domain-containing protein [Mesonia sp.]|uniref:SdiA-regulated domain-containing protein n=1 Tax=Mesonia sp. TaxID=1960830 RepID=UPI001753681B|nr:SdiA-regulated domain-containing protein [Mesonia sp.]HIB36714.1 hypothetical protein [Mesonia sp.]HIO27587.1 hypothetical protein [Flavobacteriaceae bacterium]